MATVRSADGGGISRLVMRYSAICQKYAGALVSFIVSLECVWNIMEHPPLPCHATVQVLKDHLFSYQENIQNGERMHTRELHIAESRPKGVKLMSFH